MTNIISTPVYRVCKAPQHSEISLSNSISNNFLRVGVILSNMVVNKCLMGVSNNSLRVNNSITNNSNHKGIRASSRNNIRTRTILL